ncbi:MAG: tetratricopeptide repeat protein [Gemmatimonadales bacterium]
MTEPEHTELVRRRLRAILDAPVGSRLEILERLQAEDAELALEVRSLIAAEGDGSLHHAATTAHGARTERVGPFRLLHRLGEGGMGTVYLAERQEAGFRQRVALKLLRPGFFDSQLAEHVAHERRVLARLEHPNIARLIDGGSTPAGQPYLAMEYVEGTTLLEHAESTGSTTSERVRLMAEVADAVHYAHQQLVIHRDLKPSNVMVGADGRPRLLDFGVSKLLDAEASSAGTRSAPWLTPAYASPEQVRGAGVGTLSDVYALGVILYELLSGARPYRLEGCSPAEMERSICELEPPKPSESCADTMRARELQGDLDTIVLKAMAKEPARRYQSAERLAQDLRRHLDGLPVTARPDTLRYRVGKFVRRNRTAVAVAALAALLAIVGVAAVAWQSAIARRERDRAEQARAESEEVTTFVIGLFEATSPAAGPVDTTVARALLRQGVREAEALSHQPLLQASMLDALGMVFVNLGQYERALELIERAYRLRVAQLPGDHRDLATSLAHIGRVQRSLSRYGDAKARYEEALAMQLRAHGRSHPAVAASLRDLGFLMPYLGQNEEALRYYREALEIDRAVLGDADPVTAQDVALVGLMLNRLGRSAEGLAALEEALGMKIRSLGEDDPETARHKFHVADVLVDNGRLEDAERRYREGIETRRRVLGADDIGLVHGLENLAELLGGANRGEEAEALLREAARIRASQLGTESTGYASSLEHLADELARQGRLDEALALRREGLTIRRSALGPETSATAGSMMALARLLNRTGGLAEAESLARAGIAVRSRLHGERHALVGKDKIALASILLSRGKLADAERIGHQALEVLAEQQAPAHPDRREAHAFLAELYRALGRPREAAEQLTLSGRGSGDGPSTDPAAR